MNQELELALIENIKTTFAEASVLAQAAADKGREAILKARECGQFLIEAKSSVRHGRWIEWFQSHVTDLSIETANRWMRLAETPIEQLEQALSLRQAYIAAGILPESEGNPGKLATGGASPWLTAIVKTVEQFSKLKERAPVDEWPETQRLTMKEKLRPLVEIYEAL